MNYSKAARRKAKRVKVPAGLELAPTPRRDTNGCFVARQRQQDRQDKSPDRVALKKRAAMMGQPKKWRDMRNQALGEAAGIAIYKLEPDTREASNLWGIYADLTAKHFRFCKTVLGRSPYAKTSKIEFMPERFVTSADDSGPDLRSEEEKHRAANDGWQAWKGELAKLRPTDYEAIMTAVRNPWVVITDEGQVTPRGVRLVDALRLLADMGR